MVSPPTVVADHDTRSLRDDVTIIEPRLPWLTDRRKEALVAYVFLAPWILGFLIFTVGAMIYSFRLSFFDTNLLNKSEYVGTANYRQLFDDPAFWKALRVTGTYTAIVVPVGTVLALGIALLLNQKLVLSGVWRTLYYLPAVVSGVSVAVVWNWVLNPSPDGLMNQLLAVFGIGSLRWFSSSDWALPGLILIAVWGTGANMLLYLAGLQSIPSDIKEAARVDGAGPVRAFFTVTLPLLTPTIFFNLIIGVISAFQVFTTIAVITGGGPNNATLTMVYLLYREAFRSFSFGYASAVAWVLFAIIMAFTLVLVRSADTWVHYEGGLRK
ncbi:MAG TPA: sugar ABC transporter permease [Thermomicrobiales bacterium]|jgi:multiple sugar transport system permease protein|nr:sugar ABC transporter permease [Thermomicrobiales bacterium]